MAVQRLAFASWCVLRAFPAEALASSLRGPTGTGPQAARDWRLQQREGTVEVVCNEKEEELLQTVDLPAITLGLIVHRKTGYILSKGIVGCLNTEQAPARQLVSPDLEGLTLNPGKFVHFVRDAIDAGVSDFLYNKYTSTEPGTIFRKTARKHVKRCKRQSRTAYGQVPKNDDQESLRHYLQKVDNRTGLLETLCEFIPIVENMVTPSAWCHEHSEKCMQVDLNYIMESSWHFKSTMKRIAEFAGYDWTPEVEECLSYQDVNNPLFGSTNTSYSEHCSQVEVSHEERAQLVEEAAKIDADVFDHAYSNVSLQLQSFAA